MQPVEPLMPNTAAGGNAQHSHPFAQGQSGVQSRFFGFHVHGLVAVVRFDLLQEPGIRDFSGIGWQCSRNAEYRQRTFLRGCSAVFDGEFRQ